MRNTLSSCIKANTALTFLATILALALLFAALANPGSADAQTLGTPTSTPEAEQPEQFGRSLVIQFVEQ